MRLFLILVLAGLLGALYPLWASQAQAQATEGDIVVLDQFAESQFPQGIQFTVTARSSSEIDDIRVFFKTLGNVRRSAYRNVEFEPGNKVTGTSLLQSGGSGNYFPPGTKLYYSFEIRDKAGAVLRTPQQEFVYFDNRFEWLTVTSGLITVYYYGEYVEGRAETMLDAADQALKRMMPVLGIEPIEPLRIVTYNNYRHMATALPFRSQATAEQLLTQGMAFTDQRVLLVHGFDATVNGTTSHEFVHLLVAEAAGRADSSVPSWLNEGLAEYGNIDPTDDYDAALRYGIFTRRVRPLWYQSSFGGTPDDIIIAYGQAKSVVQHMLDTYGPDKMAELMKVLQETLDIDQALQQVYGFDQYGLDTEWRETMGMEPLPPPAELELHLRELQTAPALPTLAPDMPATTRIPPLEPTAEPSPDPSPEPTAAAATNRDPDVDLGCYAPAARATSVFRGDLATLLLLVAPLGLLWVRFLRRGSRD